MLEGFITLAACLLVFLLGIKQMKPEKVILTITGLLVVVKLLMGINVNIGITALGITVWFLPVYLAGFFINELFNWLWRRL